MTLIPRRLADKPHYVFHPGRMVRRSLYGAGRSAAQDGGEIRLVQLPWGLLLGVHSREAIGFSILTAGVFDPCVSETLHRLIDPGDVVVDVGANVGYLTSLAAVRAGAAGLVIAYEPQPHVFELLRANAAGWAGRSDLAPIELRPAAVSDRTGEAQLSSGPLFDMNMGLAALHDGAAAGDGGAVAELVDVAVQRLDEALGRQPVGLLKIDVEGHEPEVLSGAQELLDAGLIRDIVFEDHEPYPDRCTELVEAAGYTLFALENDLFGLRLVEPERRGPLRPWPGPSYLATREPERAVARLRERGWQIEGIGPSTPWGRGRRRRR